jgi:hypothetical protein
MYAVARRFGDKYHRVVFSAYSASPREPVKGGFMNETATSNARIVAENAEKNYDGA